MIRDIVDVQHFLLSKPADNMELTDVQIFTHGMIKLSKTGGIYTNATESWNLKDRAIHQQWMEFKTHFIAKYEKMLAANGGTNMGQDGYGTGMAYSAIDDERSSSAESIVQCAERATQAEGKVNELEIRLAALEMGTPPTQPQTGYYSPQMAYGMMPGGHPPCTPVQIPPAYQQPQQQSNGGKWNNNEYNRGDQRRRPNNYRGGGIGGGYRGDRRNANNTQNAYSNALNLYINLLHFFSCGYDVDHDGYTCPPSCQNKIHLPNVKRDEAHMYKGACMRAQHKTFPDGIGAGRGWIMIEQTDNRRFVLDKQAAWKAQKQIGQTTWQPQHQLHQQTQ